MDVYSNEKYKSLTTELTQAIERVKSASTPEERHRSPFELMLFLIRNYGYLTDDGKKFCDELNGRLMDELEKSYATLPDSKEVRKLRRHLKAARGSALNVEAELSALENPVKEPKRFYAAARAFFVKNLQNIMNFWMDIGENTLSGQTQFCLFSLIGYCIEEFLVAFHLIEHSFGNQALSHLRSVQESLDLMELFQKDPNQVDIWIGDDRKQAWKKLQPRKVRKALQKDDVYEKFYGLFSSTGTHPSFEGLQARVKKLTEQSEKGSPSFQFRIGGTLRTREGATATLSLFAMMMELVGKIIAFFPQFLNVDEAEEVFKGIIDDFQKFELEYFVKPLNKANPKIQEIKDSIKESFKNLKSAFIRLDQKNEMS